MPLTKTMTLTVRVKRTLVTNICAISMNAFNERWKLYVINNGLSAWMNSVTVRAGSVLETCTVDFKYFFMELLILVVLFTSNYNTRCPRPSHLCLYPTHQLNISLLRRVHIDRRQHHRSVLNRLNLLCLHQVTMNRFAFVLAQCEQLPVYFLVAPSRRADRLIWSLWCPDVCLLACLLAR